MPGIEDRLAKIKAIQAEAEAKKATENKKSAKESAEKKAGLEQEKAQVEGELASAADELQKNETGLTEINAMDLSALDEESRAGIESEIVGIKEEMDNLRGKIAELTKRKQEIDETLKDAAGETEKTSDVEPQAEKMADDVLPEKLQQEVERDLNNEEQQKLQEFKKRLDELKNAPNFEKIISGYKQLAQSEQYRKSKFGQSDVDIFYKLYNKLDSITQELLQAVKQLRGDMIVDLSEKGRQFSNMATEALKDRPRTGARIELMNKILGGKFPTRYIDESSKILKEVVGFFS